MTVTATPPMICVYALQRVGHIYLAEFQVQQMRVVMLGGQGQ